MSVSSQDERDALGASGGWGLWWFALARQAALEFALAGVAHRFVERAVGAFGRVADDAVGDSGFIEEILDSCPKPAPGRGDSGTGNRNFQARSCNSKPRTCNSEARSCNSGLGDRNSRLGLCLT